MRFRSIACAALAVSLWISPCRAWGPDGHRIIGDIAMKHLRPAAKRAVAELLGDQSLADACNWADEIRKNPAYDWAKPLHYINVPKGALIVDLNRDCPEGNCVVSAIRRYSMVLRDPRAPREQRVEALKFLIHFVGDVHQPLHVSYAEDRGGNTVRVTFCGQPDWNFHSVWDDAMIKRRMVGDREAMTKRIEASISNSDVIRWQRATDPREWANESLAITRRLYRELPADHVLDEKYFQHNIDTVEDRLAAAGVRLAATLNSLFPEAASRGEGAADASSRPAAATRPQTAPSEPAPSTRSEEPSPPSSNPASAGR